MARIMSFWVVVGLDTLSQIQTKSWEINTPLALISLVVQWRSLVCVCALGGLVAMLKYYKTQQTEGASHIIRERQTPTQTPMDCSATRAQHTFTLQPLVYASTRWPHWVTTTQTHLHIHTHTRKHLDTTTIHCSDTARECEKKSNDLLGLNFLVKAISECCFMSSIAS